MSAASGSSGAAFANGTVSKTDLKRLTGEFDLESIYRLDLGSRCLHSLGCLPDCASLEFVNLSNNQLTDVSMLSGLKRLRYLNLAGNRLSNVNGLDGCEALAELNLCGNLIACTEDLQALSSLDRLESLHLQDRPGGLSNPLCMSAGYAAKIIDCLPGLACLDGDRIRGSGEAYYQLCQQIELALSGGDLVPPGESPSSSSHRAVAGMGEAFWQLGGSANTDAAAAATEAEAAFAAAVSSVRDRELRAMLRIEEWERELVTKKRKA